MKRISRRRVLAGGAAVAGVAAAVAATSDIRPMAADERIKQILRSELDYLQIPNEALDAFVRDYKADPLYSRLWDLGRRSYGVRTAAERWGVVDGQEASERTVRHLVAYFLQSTDFFQNGADVSRPVRYTRYWDPYKLGCANRFADLSS